MVTEEEIRHITSLMKVEIDDHAEYVEKIHAMIGYFDILDSAGVDSEEIAQRDVPMSGLRHDRHVPFDGRIIGMLHSYKDDYVRAPKMS